MAKLPSRAATSARLPIATEESLSKAALRSETAQLLHQAFRGVTKMVAAEIGCSSSRVYRQTEGEDANYLELLFRQLARARDEGNTDEVLPVVHWIARQFGYELAPILQVTGTIGVESAVSRSVRECAEAAAAAIEALPGGVTAAECARVQAEIDEGLAALYHLRAEIDEKAKAS